MFAMRQSPARVDDSSVSTVSRMSATSSTNVLALHLPGRPVGFRHGDLAQDRARRRGEHVHAVAEVHGLLDRVGDEEDRRLGSRHSLLSRSCMWSRVDGSRAPNGSSIRMIRGRRISVRAIATRWRMPPDSWLRILVRVALDVEPDLLDPRPGLFARARSRRCRGTRGRTRRCPRPCGCRTRCSPGTPCRDRRRARRPAHSATAPCLRSPEGAAAGRRSAGAPSTCRSPTVRGS